MRLIETLLVIVMALSTEGVFAQKAKPDTKPGETSGGGRTIPIDVNELKMRLDEVKKEKMPSIIFSLQSNLETIRTSLPEDQFQALRDMLIRDLSGDLVSEYKVSEHCYEKDKNGKKSERMASAIIGGLGTDLCFSSSMSRILPPPSSN
jgi:hypothetical protein